MASVWYIYGLALKGDWEIRYVGSTVQPERRFYDHLHEWQFRGGDKNDWINTNPGNIEMRILATVTTDHKLAERKTIHKLRAEGHRLFNIRRPRTLTQAERDRVARTMLGARKSDF